MQNNNSLNLFNNLENISMFLEVWFKEKLLDDVHQVIFDQYYSSYKRCWSNYVKFHYANQTTELMQLIEKIDNPHVLEVGCGCGTESLWMAYHGCQVKAIDIRNNRLGVAKKRKSIMEEYLNKQLSCSFEVQSIFEISKDMKFDIIWMEQTFHHIEPRSDCFKTLYDLLKPNGFIVISETNAWNPLIQLQLLKTRGLKTVVEYQDSQGVKHKYGNERVLTLSRLANKFSKINIIKKTGRHFRVFPNYTWASHFMRVEEKLPSWVVPIYTHYNYVGQKIK